jgi:hypothetical protein
MTAPSPECQPTRHLFARPVGESEQFQFTNGLVSSFASFVNTGQPKWRNIAVTVSLKPTLKESSVVFNFPDVVAMVVTAPP